jgi:hypothetical protein
MGLCASNVERTEANIDDDVSSRRRTRSRAMTGYLDSALKYVDRQSIFWPRTQAGLSVHAHICVDELVNIVLRSPAFSPLYELDRVSLFCRLMCLY